MKAEDDTTNFGVVEDSNSEAREVPPASDPFMNWEWFVTYFIRLFFYFAFLEQSL